ncbi:MAG: uroporphyrinogen decarboxylase family protein, partial [Gillisia sp.]
AARSPSPSSAGALGRRGPGPGYHRGRRRPPGCRHRHCRGLAQIFSWQYMQQIIDPLKDETPVIAFGKGCWFALDTMAKSGASALGVDWTCSPLHARYLSGGKITLQGNFDPSRLYSPPAEIKKMVHQMIDEFGKDRYIVNLGHGILPDIPVENAQAFVDAVKEYKPR